MVTLKVAMRGYYFVIDSFPVKAFFSFFEEMKRKEKNLEDYHSLLRLCRSRSHQRVRIHVIFSIIKLRP